MFFSNKNIDKPKYSYYLRWVLSYFKKIIFLLIIVFLFPACGNQRAKNNFLQTQSLFTLKSKNKHIPDYALFNNAKYSDLPIPLGFYFIDKAKIDVLSKYIKSDYLSYQGNLDFIEVINFYNKTLEREGWKILDLSNEYEGLFICSKPLKNAAISIRRLKNNKIDIFIFVQKSSNKEDRLIDLNQNKFNLSGDHKNVMNLDKVNSFDNKIMSEDSINSKSIAEYRSDITEN